MSFRLYGKRHTWNIKRKVHRACVRLVRTNGSETWVVRSVKESILRKA